MEGADCRMGRRRRQAFGTCPAGEMGAPFLHARLFRRNGATVPARRYRRSGATASPFRRNDATVPARRGGRAGNPEDVDERDDTSATNPLSGKCGLSVPFGDPLRRGQSRPGAISVRRRRSSCVQWSENRLLALHVAVYLCAKPSPCFCKQLKLPFCADFRPFVNVSGVSLAASGRARKSFTP